jgi:vancomycin resistance protein VanW
LAGPDREFPHAIYERAIPIARTDPDAYPLFEAGKLRNLNLASPHFDGLLVEPSKPLSFWRTLGEVTRETGYAIGAEFQAGCVIPAVGGGVCLLSNALFDLAVHCGWNVIERHGHSLGAASPREGELWGLDATVFYPYVDLCVAPASGSWKLEVRVEGDVLRVSTRSNARLQTRVTLHAEHESLVRENGALVRMNRIVRRVEDTVTGEAVECVIATNRRRVLEGAEIRRNCFTCGETDCHARPREAREPR